MPAYNAEKYVKEAVDSILTQSFDDLELIVINDGSRDATATILAQYTDPRLRVIHNDGNRGLIYSRNLGVDLAAGDFIAFLDSDDVAFPHRLQRQYEHLLRHPVTAAVGSWAQPMDANGHYRNFIWRYPGSSAFIKSTLLFRAYINTSTFFVRAAVMKSLRFSPTHPLAEDYDMYLRCVRSHQVENMQEVLIACRVHAESVTKTKVDLLAENLNAISRRALLELGITPSEAEIKLHRYIEWLGQSGEQDVLQASNLWLRKILAANDKMGIYDKTTLRHAAAERWFAVCYANSRQGLLALRHFVTGPLGAGGAVSVAQYAKLIVKALRYTLRSD